MRINEYTKTLSNGNTLRCRYIHITNETVAFELLGRNDPQMLVPPATASTMKKHMRRHGWKPAR